jgi:hypothetical protein
LFVLQGLDRTYRIPVFFNEILDVNKGKSLSQIFICSTLLLSEGAASSSANKPVPRP